MKNILLTLVAFSVLLLVGCQENSFVNPVSPEPVNKNEMVSNNPITGSIPLEGLLLLPGGFQSYYTIEGQINYSLELVPLDPAPPAPQYYIYLNFSIRADLSDGNNRLNVSSESEDNLYITGDGIKRIEKVFQINGSNNGLVLICTFIVTTDGIGLSEMQLAEGWVHPGINGLNKNIEPEPVTYPPVVNYQTN
jgi:hypothetical protein